MSGDGLFHIDGSNNLTAMSVPPYDAEDILQGLVEQHPDLLAGGQMDPANPRRLLLVKREHGVPDRDAGHDRWSVDHLFVDQDAVPTLVEVKRSSDTRIRREVVGQMLDYAANGVRYWPAADLLAAYEGTQRGLGNDPLEGVVGLTEDPEATVEAFFVRVVDNLRAGRIRMVFVADLIPKELRAIVEFLNEQLNPAEVLAVEVKQYRATGYDGLVIVPAVYGRTAAATQKAGVGRTRRSRDELIERSLPATREAMKRLLELADDRGFLTKETPAGLLLRSQKGESLANLYLSTWDAVDVPIKPLRERGWAKAADELHNRLQALTPKPLTPSAPSVPTTDVVARWDSFQTVVLGVADLYDRAAEQSFGPFREHRRTDDLQEEP